MLINSHGSAWSQERVDRLKTLWSEGKSASVIARQLGGISRNAVIGKVTRLGLQGRSTVNRTKHSYRRPDAAKPVKSGVFAAKKQTLAPTFDATPMPPPRADDIGRVAFADLEPHHCRFIVNDPRDGAMCCGDAKVPGQSYCAGHFARCSAAEHSPSPRVRIPRVMVKTEETKRLKELINAAP